MSSSSSDTVDDVLQALKKTIKIAKDELKEQNAKEIHEKYLTVLLSHNLRFVDTANHVNLPPDTDIFPTMTCDDIRKWVKDFCEEQNIEYVSCSFHPTHMAVNVGLPK